MRYFPIIAGLLVAGPAIAAEAYRWVDDKGVVNYGEKPPAHRPSRPVNTEPTGVIETSPSASAEPQRGAAEPRSPQAIAVPEPAPVPGGPAVRGMEFDTYIRLQPGMSEGELLVRAGRPDHVAIDNLGDYDRTFYYFPTVGNPFTTVVRLRSGAIVSLERIRKL